MSANLSRKNKHNNTVKFTDTMLEKDPVPSSKLDIKSIEASNRTKLLRAFLPDIQRTHAQMGYRHRVLPFSLTEQRLKTVQIVRRPLETWRPVAEAPKRLPQGRKAANEVEPRPKWVAKPLPVNEKLFINPNEVFTTYVRRYPWIYRESSRARSQQSTRAQKLPTKAHSDSSFLQQTRTKHAEIPRELQSAPGTLEHGAENISLHSGLS